MTHEQQAALLTATRAAAEWLQYLNVNRWESHKRSCTFATMRHWDDKDKDPARDCTCGLWQTREALRAAIEAGEGERSE